MGQTPWTSHYNNTGRAVSQPSQDSVSARRHWIQLSRLTFYNCFSLALHNLIAKKDKCHLSRKVKIYMLVERSKPEQEYHCDGKTYCRAAHSFIKSIPCCSPQPCSWLALYFKTYPVETAQKLSSNVSLTHTIHHHSTSHNSINPYIFQL